MDSGGLVGAQQGRARAGFGPAWLFAMVPAAMLAALLARPVWDVDIFWQLKLGELILAHHGPIAREPFAALHLGEPLPAVAWAGQAVMAAVRLTGGWTLLRVFDALCWLGGFWAVAAACRNRGAPAAAVAIALVLAFLPALPSASIRPQSFACLCFGLLLALQRLDLRPRTMVVLGAPLLIVWQNLHPSVGIGALAMGVTAATGWLAHVRDRAMPRPWAATILTIVGLMAAFATPDGASILAVSASNAQASMAIGASEWLPLWIPANRVNAVPILVTALVAALLVRRAPARVNPAEIVLALALLALTVTAYRFVLFWAVAIVPVIARAAGDPCRPETSPASGWLAGAGVLAAAVVMPLLVPTHFATTLPLPAIDRLRHEHLRGTVYADFPYGGPILDAGYPDWHVAYDGRYYRYTQDEWLYNGGIENGSVPLADVERKWRPVAFLLEAQHNAALADELARTPRWRRIWFRDGLVVYVRAGRSK